MKRLIKKIFPPGSRTFVVLKRIAIALGLATSIPLHELQYNDWTKRIEPLRWSPHKTLSYEPLISIIVPVFNPPKMHFLPMVYSVVGQTYTNWQLILVNACTDEDSRNFTKEAPRIDKRIVVVDLAENLGIAGNTNAGLEKAEGEYIALLDHDDTLAPQALYEVALALQGSRKPQLIYSDEDKLTNNGDYRVDPHFKPDWSPQLLRELNYINHLSVIDKKLLDKLGGYRSGFDGAQDYDLFLRLVDETARIVHIPKVLYHWRTARTSTSENFSQKKNVLDAGVKALEDHLARNNQQGEVVPVADQPGFYEIDYRTADDARIAIFVLPSPLAAEQRKFLFNFLESLQQTDRPVDLYVSKPKAKLKHIPANVTMHYTNQSDRKAFIKKAAGRAEAEFSLVVGSGVFPVQSDWLRKLMGVLTQIKPAEIVAPLLMSPGEETIVDAGYVAVGGTYLPLFQGAPDKQHTTFGNSNWARNVDAVSARCFMMRTELLKKSLDDITGEGPLLFKNEFFKQLGAAGKQVITWPFARVVYAGDMAPPANQAEYFSPNLVIAKTEFSAIERIQVARNYRDE